MNLDMDLGGFDFEEKDFEQKSSEYVCMRGWYAGEFSEPLVVTPQNGDSIIEGYFTNFETENGETYVPGVGGIGGRRCRWSVWAQYDGEEKPAAVAKALTSMAFALGITIEENGRHKLPEQTLEGNLNAINGMVGKRLWVEVRVKRGGKRPGGDETGHYQNEFVRQVKPLP